MNAIDRRRFFQHGSLGLAAAASETLMLPAGAAPTATSGKLEGHSPVSVEIPIAKVPANFTPTEDNILGPYHRKATPFRGKVTPPLEPGQPLVIQGRVWGLDSRAPLANAVIDIWQANAAGRYDNDDLKSPPAKNVFVNRLRLLTDDTGYYEYETIRPGRYKTGPKLWRPAHIHYLVQAGGYQSLVTQLYFAGDPYNKSDEFIKSSLIIEPKTVSNRNGSFQVGVFDIVLAKV